MLKYFDLELVYDPSNNQKGQNILLALILNNRFSGAVSRSNGLVFYKEKDSIA